MSDEEMRDIIAFLPSLTDEEFDRRIPSRVPRRRDPWGRREPRRLTGPLLLPQSRNVA